MFLKPCQRSILGPTSPDENVAELKSLLRMSPERRRGTDCFDGGGCSMFLHYCEAKTRENIASIRYFPGCLFNSFQVLAVCF